MAHIKNIIFETVNAIARADPRAIPMQMQSNVRTEQVENKNASRVRMRVDERAPSMARKIIVFRNLFSNYTISGANKKCEAVRLLGRAVKRLVRDKSPLYRFVLQCSTVIVVHLTGRAHFCKRIIFQAFWYNTFHGLFINKLISDSPVCTRRVCVITGRKSDEQTTIWGLSR